MFGTSVLFKEQVKKMITIFTPTYNRADLLPRLYKSLCEQKIDSGFDSDSNFDFDSDSNFDLPFEWLIVDDGSTDNTEEVVNGFIAEQRIPIRYYKKANGGKHTAINYGAKLAKGELFFIADSDDYLPKDAIFNVISAWKSLDGGDDLDLDDDSDVSADVRRSKSRSVSKLEFGGVCGLDGFDDGRIVGSGLPQEILDTTTIELRDKYGVTGDMKEVFLTSVMREFPFPEIYGERFCPEALVWNRIGTKYKLRFFNKVIYTAEYQEGGITAGITRARMKSPVATMMTYAEWFNYDISLKKKLRMAINYWRFAFCTSNRDVKIASWGNLLAPLGYLMHLRDRWKI